MSPRPRSLRNSSILIEPLTRPAFGRVQTGYRRQRCDRFVRGANATVMSAMDYAQAVVLYRQAGERSNAAAQSNLGLMYEHGQGVPQDYVSAHMWLSLEATSRATDPAARHLWRSCRAVLN
jgi:TPR repeat protein